jgi:hypothetical protein
MFGIIPLEDSTSGIIIIIIIVIDLITLLSNCLLGNHHMYQIVGGIRFSQRKELPINTTPRPYLGIMWIHTWGHVGGGNRCGGDTL